MTIQIEPHWCSLHQFILLTQGPIPEIFAKSNWEWGELKISVFLVGHFDFFFFASFLWKLVSKDGLKFWWLLYPGLQQKSKYDQWSYIYYTVYFEKFCMQHWCLIFWSKFFWKMAVFSGVLYSLLFFLLLAVPLDTSFISTKKIKPCKMIFWYL